MEHNLRLLLLVQLLAVHSRTAEAAVTSSSTQHTDLQTLQSSDGRLLDAHFTRFGSRIDQLILRLDHLDSRINRFTSLVQGRLDNIENSLTTTKLRMDIYTEELNRIEDQLTRKWKSLESKFALLIPSIDSKLETKLTLIQRENRRHNDYLSGGFAAMGQRVKDSTDGFMKELWRVNSTVIAEKCVEAAGTLAATPIIGASPSESIMESHLTSLIQEVTNRTSDLIKSGSSMQLLSGKVSNMFDDLVQRTDSVQTGIKDVLGAVNATRREVQDQFLGRVGGPFNKGTRVSTTAASSSGFSEVTTGMTSSESMSAVIVEALASVESMSTALGRRMAELGRSIDERFEMVSMSINGFLESCVRIQDGTPLIEEHIAVILEKLLDSFDNSTKFSASSLGSIRETLATLVNQTAVLQVQQTQTAASCSASGALDEFLSQFLEHESRIAVGGAAGGTMDVVTTPMPPLPQGGGGEVTPSTIMVVDPYESQTQEILRNSDHMSEDEKMSLWESLFPGSVPQQVPGEEAEGEGGQQDQDQHLDNQGQEEEPITSVVVNVGNEGAYSHTYTHHDDDEDQDHDQSIRL